MTAPRLVRFGVFEMDLKTGELRKKGVTVKLQEQPFRVLAMLVEHAGDLVTRDELRRRLWPDHVFVDFEHNLNKAIAKVRQALGDLAESPRYVETLERRGHRFIAPVEVAEDARATSTMAPGAASQGRIVCDGRAIPLREGMNLIGRDSSAAIPIDSSNVSRYHAVITVSDEGTKLIDLGSKNGTFANGLPVLSPTSLSDGDEIVVGSTTVVFRSTPVAEAIRVDTSA